MADLHRQRPVHADACNLIKATVDQVATEAGLARENLRPSPQASCNIRQLQISHGVTRVAASQVSPQSCSDYFRPVGITSQVCVTGVFPQSETLWPELARCVTFSLLSASMARR